MGDVGKMRYKELMKKRNHFANNLWILSSWLIVILGSMWIWYTLYSNPEIISWMFKA